MRRRAFLAWLGAFCGLPPALAQPGGPARRIAVLELSPPTMLDEQWSVFDTRMRELGYEKGGNLMVDRRRAEGDESRLPQLARELLAARPEIIVATTTPAAQVLKGMTRTVPILTLGIADPVGTGLVASLARPGGNLTGISNQLHDIGVKRLDLLLEIRPSARRVAMLGPASNAGVQVVLKQVREAARTRGVEVRFYDAADAAGVNRAFDAFAADAVDALFVTAIMFQHHPQIVDLAARRRLAAAYVDRQILDAGGLLVLGPDRSQLYRHAADYAHRILQGAKPAEMPIIQPTGFWLGVNLRTARSLGIKVPQSLLLRADRVIE